MRPGPWASPCAKGCQGQGTVWASGPRFPSYEEAAPAGKKLISERSPERQNSKNNVPQTDLSSSVNSGPWGPPG